MITYHYNTITPPTTQNQQALPAPMEKIDRRGIAPTDGVLQRAIWHRLIHSLRMQKQQGPVKREGKRKRVSVWRLPAIS